MVQAKRKANTIELLIPALLQGEVEGWRNPGWAGVTQATSKLLSYWFEEDKDAPQFHRYQQQAIETIIYCHEILGIEDPSQLYEKFVSESTTTGAITGSKAL